MRSEFGQIPTIPLGSAWNVWGRVKYWIKVLKVRLMHDSPMSVINVTKTLLLAV